MLLGLYSRPMRIQFCQYFECLHVPVGDFDPQPEDLNAAESLSWCCWLHRLCWMQGTTLFFFDSKVVIIIPKLFWHCLKEHCTNVSCQSHKSNVLLMGGLLLILCKQLYNVFCGSEKAFEVWENESSVESFWLGFKESFWLQPESQTGCIEFERLHYGRCRSNIGAWYWLLKVRMFKSRYGSATLNCWFAPWTHTGW